MYGKLLHQYKLKVYKLIHQYKLKAFCNDFFFLFRVVARVLQVQIRPLIVLTFQCFGATEGQFQVTALTYSLAIGWYQIPTP